MNEAFDISKVVGKVSKLNITPGQEQIEYIPFEKILPDPKNGYSMEEIEELARNIETVGLQQPLRVYPDSDGDCVMVYSGHRRRSAIGILVESGSEMFAAGVPCIVDRSGDSPALREFKLLMANTDNRKMTDADESIQLERLQDVLRRLEDEGFKFPGRARDWVSELSGVSRSKIARLQAIRNNLEPSLLAMFDKNQIKTAVAYELQKLPQDFQERLFLACKNLNMYDVQRAAEWYESGKRWEPCLACPDGKPCRRGDTFLKHDIEHPRDACFGNRCCLECREGTKEYYACDRRCSKAEAQRKEERDQKKGSEEKRREAEQNKIKAQTSVSAARIVKAVNAAGVANEVMLKTDKWGRIYSVGQIREMAEGIFPPDFNRYQDPFSPKSISECLPELCEQLQCSADYLLGRTEDLNQAKTEPLPAASADPSAQEKESDHYEPEQPQPKLWRPVADPPADGSEAICLFHTGDSRRWSISVCKYADGFFKTVEYGIPCPCVLWWIPYYDPEGHSGGNETGKEDPDDES